MARKSKNDVNKSQAIRDLLAENPRIAAKDAVAALNEKGIKVASGLFYLVKGKMLGRRGRRRKLRKQIAGVAATTGNSDALTTIRKIKSLAAEVGGMSKLKALVEVLTSKD